MTRYRYYTATTLDGFLADTHDSLDWLFEQEGGDGPQSDGSPVDYGRFLATVGAMVMGTTTYRFVLDQVARGDEPGLPALPCFVFTHQQFDPAPGDVRFVAGEPAAHRARIEAAADGRDVWLVGGGGLAADFAAAGMLDDVLLSYAPVTLGAGRPLFGRPFDLRLREYDRSGPFLVAVYDVLGPRATAVTPSAAHSH